MRILSQCCANNLFGEIESAKLPSTEEGQPIYRVTLDGEHIDRVVGPNDMQNPE